MHGYQEDNQDTLPRAIFDTALSAWRCTRVRSPTSSPLILPRKVRFVIIGPSGPAEAVVTPPPPA
jgi:hypothetical protein